MISTDWNRDLPLKTRFSKRGYWAKPGLRGPFSQPFMLACPSLLFWSSFKTLSIYPARLSLVPLSASGQNSGHDSPPQFNHGEMGCPHFLRQPFRRLVGPNGIATGEDIDSGISMFRPGVDEQVRLSDNNYTADPMRIELVECLFDYRSSSPFCCVDQQVLQPGRVIQQLLVA